MGNRRGGCEGDRDIVGEELRMHRGLQGLAKESTYDHPDFLFQHTPTRLSPPPHAQSRPSHSVPPGHRGKEEGETRPNQGGHL